MVIELVILARYVYRNRAKIQAGIESTCEHSLASARDLHLCTVLPCPECGKETTDL